MSANEPIPSLWDIPVPAPAPAPIFKALAAAGLIAPFLSHGAIITVNTTAENGAVGQCSLRDAARALQTAGVAVNGCAIADAAPIGNEIRFAANVVGTITYTGPHNVFAYAGVEFNPQSNLAIVGPGASVLGVSCAANTVSVGSMLVYPNVGSNVTISGLAFTNCLASGAVSAGGGGLTVLDFAPGNTANQITLSDLVISGNRGYVGGLGVSSVGSTTLRRLSISGNTGELAGGVAIQGLLDSAHVDIQSSTLSGNTGRLLGGGAVFTSGDVSVNNATVSGNTGGLGALLLDGFDIGVRHSTIVRNTRDLNANTSSFAALIMGSSLFGEESKIQKSAIVGQKALTVTSGLNNSIVCGNSQFDLSTNTNVVANYNLLGAISPSGGGFFGVGNVTNCTSTQLNSWLGPLANNGGATQTHALLAVPGNPAINGGDPAYTGSPSDQTGGTPRVSGGRTDMGAFEFSAAPAAAATPVPLNGAVGLGALSLALAALGARRRKKTDDSAK